MTETQAREDLYERQVSRLTTARRPGRAVVERTNYSLTG